MVRAWVTSLLHLIASVGLLVALGASFAFGLSKDLYYDPWWLLSAAIIAIMMGVYLYISITMVFKVFYLHRIIRAFSGICKRKEGK